MRDERFTERIRRYARQGSLPSTKLDSSILIESVRKHLEKILSTRQGSVPIDREYGLSELPILVEDYSFAYQEELKNHLENTILRYEPRLNAIQVSGIIIDPSKQIITCNISAQFKKTFNLLNVYFTTVLTSKGRVLVIL
ncbi:type VI secretion system baseplate subunit TssE [Fluoribacter dumoffii]|uniref:type VI secretion system baseplate subunit TssE n=1 Tax=Fluoribacter dumoffii TaxID=463 RepID=UPI002242FE4A|nr:type VI secretion system baseplate subunit TssE [Fluoribacter dumoffii]MCW8416754.1 type VI secretion system baseplate subunit TssE [Fluoribacter dumoffii]MCW8455406.1 type VI secretion system baseplate subunit TssE [Fluoribacter dumoffii]MCW8460516.1 type VI secretion system baseplate subunit TssE [Fluoribacter dumoffii]MCW8483997.1 type VI secretion system baseplate subunit TssE [Fluoribacter dumoffii]